MPAQWWTHKVYVVFVYVQCTTVVSVLQLSELTHSGSRFLEAHAWPRQEIFDSVKQNGTMQALEKAHIYNYWKYWKYCCCSYI